MNELERVKQKYEEYIGYAEKWLQEYKETNDELYKAAFALNMMQVGLYIAVYGFKLDSRYLKMKAELETLK